MIKKLREINLELGQPTVTEALLRMDRELATTKKVGCTVLKLIHGYGSSGKGGKIRTAVRRDLTKRKGNGTIRNWIPGEKFSIFESATLDAFNCCDELRTDTDLNRYNTGVTIVVLTKI